MTSRMLPAIFLVLLAACAMADARPPEELLANPPAKWVKSYQLNNGQTRITDFLPPGETEQDWTTKLTFEAHANLVGSDPIHVILDEVASEKQKCTFVQHFNLFSGLENGYPTSARLIMCGQSHFSKKGEVSLMKTIAGEDYFYIVRWVTHVKPFKLNKSRLPKAEIANWSTYFRRIGLCRPGSDNHPCPASHKRSEKHQ